ncbi:MAG TPA: hypothetical protein VNK96_02595 [Fimbriimonadales bacterium]|nr:hypothetical protein [Fimbriimonadales bacterium]
MTKTSSSSIKGAAPPTRSQVSPTRTYPNSQPYSGNATVRRTYDRQIQTKEVRTYSSGGSYPRSYERESRLYRTHDDRIRNESNTRERGGLLFERQNYPSDPVTEYSRRYPPIKHNATDRVFNQQPGQPPSKKDNPPSRKEESAPPARREENNPPSRRSEFEKQPVRENQAPSYRQEAPSKPDSVIQGAYPRKRNRTDTGPIYQPRTKGIAAPSRVYDNPSRENQKTQSHNQTTLLTKRPPQLALPVLKELKGSDQFKIQDQGFYKGFYLRIGYVHYDPFWCDYHFGYNFYYFYPSFGCYFSPYYWYWCVPPYIWYSRIIVVSPRIIVIINDPVRWVYCGYGAYHDYYGYTYSRHYDGYSALDRALSDLVDAFKYSDVRALERLAPPGGRVDIFMEGKYAYTVSTDDYFDMTADLIQSVYTENFQIVRVRKARSGEYRVIARHDYLDPWNERQTTWLNFTLDFQNGRYVIVEAGSSRQQIDW